jgi:outer membrane protein assembly factor BamB
MKMRYLLLAMMTVLTISCSESPGETRPADWFQYLGPNRNGKIRLNEFKTDWANKVPKKLWEQKVGIGFSAIVVKNGKAYTMGNEKTEGVEEDVVYCFDTETGRKLWAFRYESKLIAKYFNGGPCSTPTLDGDKLYSISRVGLIYCLNAHTGKVLWKVDSKKDIGVRVPIWGFACSALVYENELFFDLGGRQGSLVVLNKETGKLIRKTLSYKPGYSSVLLYQENKKDKMALFHGDGLSSFDPQTGEENWYFKWKTKYNVNAALPVIHENYFFLSSGYKRGSALIKVEENKVEKIYEIPDFGTMMNPAFFYKDHLYGINGTAGSVLVVPGSLQCREFKTGKLKWKIEKIKVGTVILVNEKLVILSESGTLILAEANSDKYVELASLKILDGRCWTTPAVSGNKIFARNAQGRLVCYQTGKK